MSLWDFHSEGYFFTWLNRRADGEFVEKRLDRVLITEFWVDFFPTAMVRNEIWDRSDYLLLLDYLVYNVYVSIYRSGLRLFRFEAKWLYEDNFKEVMREVWEMSESNLMYGIYMVIYWNVVSI